MFFVIIAHLYRYLLTPGQLFCIPRVASSRVLAHVASAVEEATIGRFFPGSTPRTLPVPASRASRPSWGLARSQTPNR